MNDFNLCLQPRLTGYHLPDRRFLVQASLAALDPFEMLDGVGDIDLVARNTRCGEGFVQKTTCRADERMALAIFHVARLFTNEQDACGFPPIAENRLGGVSVQIAPYARTSTRSQLLESLPPAP